MRLGRWGWIVVVTAGLGLQEVAPARAQTPPGADTTLARIETAWRKGDAGALAALASPEGVQLVLPEATPRRGQFMVKPLRELLRLVFRTTRTESFELDPQDVEIGPGGIAMALADRTWRRRGEGRVHRDRVLLHLTWRDRRWVLEEIRVLP